MALENHPPTLWQKSWKIASFFNIFQFEVIICSDSERLLVGDRGRLLSRCRWKNVEAFIIFFQPGSNTLLIE